MTFKGLYFLKVFIKINLIIPVMSELTEDKSLREFWVRCTDQNVLYVHPERLVTSFEQKYGSQLHSKYGMEPQKGTSGKYL